MANPPKQKGTKGETELLRLLNEHGFNFVRRPAGARTDLKHTISRKDWLVNDVTVLATRPDRGRWLITMTLDDFARVMSPDMDDIEIEVKRRKTFAHHTLFESELA